MQTESWMIVFTGALVLVGIFQLIVFGLAGPTAARDD